VAKPKYRAAIIGCGRIASLFADDKKRRGVVTHAQAYRAHPKTELIAACDLDRKRLTHFGRRWNVKALYDDLDAMMKKERPDLLSVCTGNSNHEAIVRQAVRRGVKGIICEKPISDSLEAADRMIRLCRKKNVPLLVNYSRRYNELHHRLRAILAGGGLGDIQTVSCYYTAGVMNTGTHLFDILRFFFGDVSWVCSHPDKILKAPDPTFDVYLYFKKGFGCTISTLDVAHYMQFEIDIYGTRGRIRIEDSGMRAQFWGTTAHQVYSGYKTLEPRKVVTAGFSHNFLAMIDNLVAACEGKQKPYCSGEDGRAAFEIAAAAHLSLRTGKKVKLPLKNKKMKLESK